MPVAGGPKITKTGILLEVDAADKNSYPGSGTTWTNQVPTGLGNGTLNNISFDSTDSKGALIFTGSNTFVDFGNIGNLSSAWSFQVAFKPAPTSSGDAYTILSYASGSDTGSLTFKLDYSSSTQEVILSTFSTASATAKTVHAISASVASGSWSIVHGTFGSSLAALYVNGLGQAYQPTTGSSVGYNASNQVYAGGTYGLGSGFYTGSMANVTVNNADLDGLTVNKNYNAIATRFGLPIRRSTITDADAFNFVEVAGISDETQAAAINTLVLGLKSNNLWTKMVAIYPFVGGSAYAHKFNLKDTSLYPVAWAGGIDHTSLGVETTATNAIGYTGLIPRLAVTDVSSSFHIAMNFNTNSSASTNVVMGNSDNPIAASEFKKSINIAHGYFGSTLIQYAAFAATQLSATRVGNGQGLWVAARLDNTIYGYRRSAVQTINLSGGPYTFESFYPNNQIRLLQGTSYGGGPAGMIVNCATVGDGLTQTDVDNLYTLLNTYNSSLSRL